MSVALARCISILAHPVVTIGLALSAVAAGRGLAARSLAEVLVGCVLAAGLVMAYSAWRVRRGDWAHVDASARDERRGLNRFLLPLLAAAALLARSAGDLELSRQLAAACVPVLAGLASARWCHLSLHMAFAVFAAVVLAVAWPWTGVPTVVLLALVAWSRRALGRHAPRDLVAGAAAGFAVGVLACWPLLDRPA